MNLSWQCHGTDRQAVASGIVEPHTELDDSDMLLLEFVLEWLWSWACKNFTSDPYRATWSVDWTGTIQLTEGE